MRRTQLYLAEEHYRALHDRARRRGTTLAAEIREILDRHLNPERTDKRTGADSLDAVVGIGVGGGQAVAEHVDDYLYGRRR